MKKGLIIILIYVFSLCVFAYSDSYITLDSAGLPVCLAVDSLDTPACYNQTLQIEGTNDHFIYILPYTAIQNNDTTYNKLVYFVSTPFSLFMGLGAFFMGLMFLGAFIYIVLAFAGFSGRK